MLITVRLDPSLLRALALASATETRSRSQQIRRYLARGLSHDGYLMAPAGDAAGVRDAR